MSAEHFKQCLFCPEEVKGKNGYPECDCGGYYIIAPRGSSEYKFQCPACDRKIALESKLY